MKPDFKYQLINDNDIIRVCVDPKPDWDEFEQFVDLFLKNEDVILIAQDLGMDRHQVRYRKEEKQFILQYEHYTDSIWIEQDF
jgi:hypothetical protein